MSLALRLLHLAADRRARLLAYSGATAAVTALLLGAAAVTAPPASAPIAGAPSAGSDGGVVALESIVASWPAEYTVTGVKSEPLYVEHMVSTRRGDEFALRIDAIAQGDTALGSQEGAVRVTGDGRIEWISGCAKSTEACRDDPALRGFLTPAAVLSAERTGALPSTGIARILHGVGVVCLDPSALYPGSPAVTDLEPCLSRSSGALVAHWSQASSAFVGPTLGAGFVERDTSDPELLPPLSP